MTRRSHQLPLFPRHPGGRPRKKDAGVPHAPRPAHKGRFPLHVTLRIKDHVWQLRSARMFRAVRRCVPMARERFGFRLVHYSVQGNHAHLIAEAEDARALSRGVQGLAIRLAKAMNRVMEKRGKVFADRYHARELRTPREVRHALLYVLNNARKHMAEYGRPPGPLWIDPFSSATHFDGWEETLRPPAGGSAPGPPGAPAETWLVRVGWRRHGLISISEVPKA
jgi:REP element-mobilizing transposase RayT